MRWKWIAGIACVLAIGLVAALYVIVSRYDFNDFKPEIAEAVRKATGRELTLAGNMRLSVGLHPALVVEGVSFQNAPWGSRPKLATIKRLQVQVSLIPLVKGHIEVNRLSLIGPDILVETNATGISNLRFKTAKPQTHVTEKSGVAMWVFDIDKVSIRDGHLTYKDGKSKQTRDIDLQQIAITKKADDRLALDLKGAYNGHPCKVRGTLGTLHTLMNPEKSWPVTLEIQAARTTLAANGTIQDVRNGKGLNLNVTGQGKSLRDTLDLFNVSGLPQVGPFTFAASLTDSSNHWSLGNVHVVAGNKQTARIKLDGTVKDMAALKGVALDFSVEGEDVTNLKEVVGKPLPVQGPFRLSGHALLSARQSLGLSDLHVSIDGTDLAGSLSLDLARTKPSLKASLSCATLDLRPVLSGTSGQPQQGSQRSPNAAEKKEKVFPAAPLPLEILGALDANVDFQAKQVMLPLLTLRDLNAQAELKSGHLALTSFKGVASNGTFNGHLNLVSAGEEPRMHIALQADDYDLKKMFEDMGMQGFVEGKLDVRLDLQGRGGSVAQLMAALNGTTVVIMEQGRINDRFVGLLRGDLGHVVELFRKTENEARYTDVNCLVAGLDITNGLAKSTVLALDTNDVTITGRGKIDLATEVLDLALKPSPKKGFGIKGLGRLSLSLGQLTKPLKVGGTLAHPSLAIDASGTMVTLGKALGGAALLGPVGLAAALAGGKLGGRDPCRAAIEAANAGAGQTAAAKPQKHENAKGTLAP